MEEARHVLIASGDRLAEVAAAVKDAGGGEAAGLHRHFYVTRANQTVVMTTGPGGTQAPRVRTANG